MTPTSTLALDWHPRANSYTPRCRLRVAACRPNPRRRGTGEPIERRLATVRGESSQKLVGLPVRIRQL